MTKKRSKKPAHAEEQLARRLQAGGTRVVRQVVGARKIADVLMDFLAPYRPERLTEDDFRKLVALGAMAWNAALLTGADRERLVNAGVGLLPPDARAGFLEIVRGLIGRKERFFAADRRLIVEHEVTVRQGRLEIAIASQVLPAVPPPAPPPAP